MYSADGSLLKTTSFPAGFVVNKTGVAQFLTNIPISTSQNITTETVFTDLNKTNLLSNPINTPTHISNLITPASINFFINLNIETAGGVPGSTSLRIFSLHVVIDQTIKQLSLYFSCNSKSRNIRLDFVNT